MKKTVEEFMEVKDRLNEISNGIVEIVNKYKGKLDCVDEVLLTHYATKCKKYAVELNRSIKNTYVEI